MSYFVNNPIILHFVIMAIVKILYLITKSNFGGAQRYVYDLALYGQGHGHEVAVGLGGAGPLRQKLEEEHIPVTSIEGLGRDISFREDVRSALSTWKLIRRNRPDIIHVNSSKMGGVGSLLGRISNGIEHLRTVIRKEARPARIIFTGHGWAFNENRNDFERTLIGFFHWLTIQLAHKTIAVSKKTSQQMLTLRISPKKVVVVNNGIDEFPLRSRADARASILSGTSWEGRDLTSDIVIGTISELHKNKGLNYAIDGIARLPQEIREHVRFIIIGEEGDERQKLEVQISALGLQERVLIAGKRENAKELLAAFDIFTLSSITEAFPYAILEAGRAGLPIVASAVGGIPEMIDDMESGILIHSRNPNEIARALRFLIENPERREQFASAIKTRIADRFSIEKMAEETYALYDSL